MPEQTIAIIANGEKFESAFFRSHSSDVDIIIAADGGGHVCRECKIQPDYIIGDLDSITDELKTFFSETPTIHISDQYSTDMEKALKFAESLKPSTIKVFSAFGLRSDHAAANLLNFSQFVKRSALKIYDNFGCLQILESGRHILKLKPGTTLSLFSVTPIKSLSLKGFRYNLSKKDYKPHFVGISNVVESASCSIQFDSGILYLYEVF